MKKPSFSVTIFLVVIFCLGAVMGAIFFGPEGIKTVKAATAWLASGSNLYCDSVTNVGIGTASPITKFQVKTQTQGNFGVRTPQISGITTGVQLNSFSDDGGSNMPMEFKASQFLWSVAGVETMRINSTGLGIGTASPSKKLEVVGAQLIKPDSTWTAGDTAYLYLGATDHYIKSSYSGRDEIKGIAGVDLSTYGGVRLTVLDNGNVGIGLTNPAYKFQVKLATDVNFVVTGNAASGVYLSAINDASSANAPMQTNGSIQKFQTNGAERLRIDSSGNVGVGTVNPITKFQVKVPTGNLGIRTPELSGIANGVQLNSFSDDGSSNLPMEFKANRFLWSIAGTQKMSIENNGDLYSGGKVYASQGFSCSSDERLKYDIKPLQNSLAKVLGLEGVSFKWKSDPTNQTQLGLIAQDVEKVLPELVNTDSNGYKTVSYDGFSALLINAVKEQQQNIDQLKGENQELKLRLEKLESRVNN